MSRLGRLLGLVRRTPTVLRTLAPLRPAQLRAQVAHLFTGVQAPVRLDAASLALAVEAPSTPFLDPAPHVDVRPAAGDSLALELLSLALEVVPGTVDWATDRHGPLFAYHLHEQAWLRHAGLAPAARRAVLDDWIARHREGVGWDPHPISLRLLSWGKLLLSAGALPPDEDLRSRVIRSMADQAETLARGVEVRLQANHLLSNRIGVVWAGLLFEGEDADRWRAGSEALLAELDAQVHRDGTHEERSPMYHSLILENGLDLLNLARRSPRTPEGFVEALGGVLGRMTRALARFTGPGNRIALFADSAWGVAAEPPALFDYADRLGVVEGRPGPGDLPFDDSGYARIDGGDFVLIASTAGPSPDHQPGHAHCDVLAFELFVGGRRLVTDTGVYEYRPGEHRDRARATASHATLRFDGKEQSEVWAAHRVGGRARVEPVEAGADFAEYVVRGWSRGAPRHVRRFERASGEIVVRDTVRSGGHAVESRLPLAPEWTVELLGERARVRHADGTVVTIELEGGLAWTIERAPFHPTFHAEVERNVLVGRGVTPLGSTLRFRRD